MTLSARKPESFLCGAAEIAALLGVSDRQVRNYAKDGMPQHGRGKFDARACVQWKMSELRDDAPAGNEERSSRSALNIAQRQRVELEIARLRNELLPAPLVERAMNTIASICASQLDSLGPRLAGELADVSEPAAIQARLFDECRAIRTAIAGAAREFAELLIEEAATMESDDDDPAD